MYFSESLKCIYLILSNAFPWLIKLYLSDSMYFSDSVNYISLIIFNVFLWFFEMYSSDSNMWRRRWWSGLRACRPHEKVPLLLLHPQLLTNLSVLYLFHFCFAFVLYLFCIFVVLLKVASSFIPSSLTSLDFICIVFVLFCICVAFVLYLSCIHIVFVLYLYCIAWESGAPPH